MTESLIDFDALKQAVVKTEPFPYIVLPQLIKSEHLASLVDSFPAISNRGSIPVTAVTPKPLFQQLVKELEGTELRNVIAGKFEADLDKSPTMLTLRGHTTEKDGRIHTDSKSKLFTLLLYLNSDWDNDAGKLRLLKNKDSLDDYVEEISPHAGSCVIFKVTDNCWHGHKPFNGKRSSVQLNYLTGQTALIKHLNHHRFSAWLKKLMPKAFQKSENY